MTAAEQTTVRKVDAAPGELRFAVELDGSRREIWFRSDAPITERADPAVPAVLLPAMRAGAPLRFHDPIDPLLLRQAQDVMGLFASWRWLWSHLGYGTPRRIEVEAPRAAPVARAGGAEASFFSGGVDGFFTALDVPEISHLIYVAGLDNPIGHPAEAATRAALGEAAERLGKRLITVETNTRELADDYVGYMSYLRLRARGGRDGARARACTDPDRQLEHLRRDAPERVAPAARLALAQHGGDGDEPRELARPRGQARADRGQRDRPRHAARVLSEARAGAQLRAMREVPAHDGRAGGARSAGSLRDPPGRARLGTGGPHEARSPDVRRRMACRARAGRAARSAGAS